MRMVHCGYHVPTMDHGSEGVNPAAMRTMDDSSINENNNEPSIGNGDRYLSSDQQQQQTTASIYSECEYLYSNHLVTVLAICSLVFLLFTAAMGFEQLEAIETGKGKIARMKQSVGASGGTEFCTVTTEFNEMFGGDSPFPTWHWYLPTPIQFPRGMRQVVLGYEFNEACRPGVPYRQEDDAHKEQDALLRNAEAGQLSPPQSPESDRKVSNINNNSNNNNTAEIRRSLYTGRPVEPLPLVSRRSNSRSPSTGEESNKNINEEHGITLVDRTKARLA